MAAVASVTMWILEVHGAVVNTTQVHIYVTGAMYLPNFGGTGVGGGEEIRGGGTE